MVSFIGKGRSQRIAVVVAAAVFVGVLLTGCVGSGGGSETPVAAPSASGSPEASSTASSGSSALPTARADGFDTKAIYAACDAAVPADVWGGQQPVAPGPIVADSIGPASSDGYTADHTNGDPAAVYINVQYFTGDSFAFSALCVASGDPSAPRVEYIRTLN
ncbi:hypothetical protein [Leifsonia aquatica]|uniref:hypothetical protein n=1 Tax=Leifsonia aquatica TaxID=144185 RepID=UPI000469D14C|nr:hypothetical protein [Leifsonia aquatica]